jgi:hypothetical protein
MREIQNVLADDRGLGAISPATGTEQSREDGCPDSVLVNSPTYSVAIESRDELNGPYHIYSKPNVPPYHRALPFVLIVTIRSGVPATGPNAFGGVALKFSAPKAKLSAYISM